MKSFKKLLGVVVCLSVLLSFSPTAKAAMVFTDNGSLMALGAYFNATFPSSKSLVIHLFCTSVSPTDTILASAYTECTGGGYSAITLTNGSWTVSLTGSIAQAAYAAQTFTFTGTLTTNGTVYGYYLVDAAANAQCSASLNPYPCCTGSTTGTCPDLITSETFGSTFTPANNGDNIVLTPVVQMSHGTPAS